MQYLKISTESSKEEGHSVDVEDTIEAKKVAQEQAKKFMDALRRVVKNLIMK